MKAPNITEIRGIRILVGLAEADVQFSVPADYSKRDWRAIGAGLSWLKELAYRSPAARKVKP